MFCTMLWYIVVQIYISKCVPYFVPCYGIYIRTYIYVQIYVRKTIVLAGTFDNLSNLGDVTKWIENVLEVDWKWNRSGLRSMR